MSEDLAKLKVTIEGDSKSFKREMSQSEAEAKRASEAIKKAMSGINFKNKLGKEELAAGNLLKKTLSDIKSGGLPQSVKDSMKDYIKQAQLAAGIKVHTEEYKDLSSDIDAAEKALSKLEREQQRLSVLGEDKGLSGEYQDLTEKAKKAQEAIEELIMKRGQLEKTGEDVEFTPKYQNLYDSRMSENQKLKSLENQKKERMNQGIPMTDVDASGHMFNLDEEIVKTKKHLQELEQEMESLEGKNKMLQASEATRKLSSEIEATKEKLAQYVSDDSVFTVTASAGITGHWDNASRTYYVTAMSTDDGYVDIDALYGTGERYLTTRKGLRITTRAGKYILVQSGGAHIRKRFSISKAKDGKIGLSYDLHCSTLVIRKQKDGKTLMPASITFSATQNDNGLVRNYSGRYRIQEAEDGTTYTNKYVSTDDEIQKIYTPSSTSVKAVRCTLLSAGGVELDTQTVIIIADAEGLAEDIKKAQDAADEAKEAIVTTNQNVTNIETGMAGLRAELSETTTDLHGLVNNTLLYNVKYHDNEDGTTTLNAVVYKNGTDVTKTYPDRWFTWYRKTESGETYLGYGYSITVNNSEYEFGGVCVGTFTTYDTLYLTTRSGKQIVTRSGNHITVWKEN